MSRSVRTRRKSRKAVSLPEIRLKGDHGTGTAAAMLGTFVEPIEDENGKNPNHIGRRRRVDRLSEISLSMRQQQAGSAIRDAYCRVEMLSSGGELKERVQSQLRPDVTAVHQTQTIMHFTKIMGYVPNDMRYVVEHVCMHNKPLATLPNGSRHGSHSANLKVALDIVANKLRY